VIEYATDLLMEGSGHEFTRSPGAGDQAGLAAFRAARPSQRPVFHAADDFLLILPKPSVSWQASPQPS